MKRSALWLIVVVLLNTGAVGQSRVSIGAVGGLQTSLDGFDGGRSLSATLLYDLSEHMQLTLTSGYLSWHGLYDGSFSAVPILVGVRVRSAGSDVVPYGKLEVGLYSTRSSQMPTIPLTPLPLYQLRLDSLGLPTPIDVRPVSVYHPRSYSTTFGYGVGVGIMVPLSEQIALDVGAAMHYLDETHAARMSSASFLPGAYGTAHRYFTVFGVGLFVHL